MSCRKLEVPFNTRRRHRYRIVMIVMHHLNLPSMAITAFYNIVHHSLSIAQIVGIARHDKLESNSGIVIITDESTTSQLRFVSDRRDLQGIRYSIICRLALDGVDVVGRGRSEAIDEVDALDSEADEDDEDDEGLTGAAIKISSCAPS